MGSMIGELDRTMKGLLIESKQERQKNGALIQGNIKQKLHTEFTGSWIGKLDRMVEE